MENLDLVLQETGVPSGDALLRDAISSSFRMEGVSTALTVAE